MEKEYEIIKKILGEINPVGETNTDNERFENLKNTIFIAKNLIYDIEKVAQEKDYSEYSRSRAGKLAYEFRNNLTEFD